MASCLFPGGGHRRRRVRRARYSLWIVRLAAHWRPGWEPARLLTGMVNQAQRAGWRPLGNVQCGRSTQENREVLVVEVGRGSPEGGTVGASSMAKGLRAAVDPCIGRVDSSWPVGGSALPMGTDCAKTPTERRVSPPSVGQTPLGNGWRSFLSLPFRQLKPPLGAPHASPQLPLSRRYPGPLLGYPFDRDAHSRRGRLFEWALGWRLAFASPPGGGSLQNPAVGPWDGRSPSLSRASRRLPLGRRWEWTSPWGRGGLV